MKFAYTLALLALCLLPLGGCVSSVSHTGGQTELADDIEDAIHTEVAGRVATIPTIPAHIVGASWNDPSTRFPEYLAQVVDPYNYPHLAWRAFYTIWSLPINPVQCLTKRPMDDWNGYVSPIRETVTYDHVPTPFGGNGPKYWASRSNNLVMHAGNIWSNVKYHFLNTNSYLPPYDRWYPEVIQGEKTMIHRTLDLHLFNFDWENPYID